VQQAGLGQVDATRDAGYAKVDDTLNKVLGMYDGDLGRANTEYGAQSTDNQRDLQTNKQTALQSAVQGRQGLFGTLASLGALNGSGIELANDAVRNGANEDLSTAANTFGTNQRVLDSSFNTFKDAEDKQKQMARDAADNNKMRVRNDAAKTRQQFLLKIGNDYQDEGKTSDAKPWMDQASALFPEIASTNVPAMSIGYTGGTYTAPTLSQYVGKADTTSVRSTPGSMGTNNLFNIPGLLAANRKDGTA
jgi:hypothetical protein